MSTPTDYLHSERHFRLYEPYITRIVNSWPLTVSFQPVPPVASVETLSSRIRIARDALLANIQSSSELWATAFDVHKFLGLADEIVVSTTARPGYVVCGPMDAVRDVKREHGTDQRAPVEPVVEQVIPKVNLLEPELELIIAILTLHHYRLLTEPSTITTTKFHDAIHEFSRTHDIAVSNLEHTFTIL